MAWSPGHPTRFVRLRLALPLALPAVAFIGAHVVLRYVPAVADRIDPGWRTIAISACVLALLTLCLDLRLPRTVPGTIDGLLLLSRTEPAALATAIPFLDRRRWVAHQRLQAALDSGDRERIRTRYAELLALGLPKPEADGIAAWVMFALGDFATALRLLRAARFPAQGIPLLVLGAKEAGLPVDIELVEAARRVPQYLFDARQPTELVLGATAHVAAINGDVESAIAWAEAALPLETDPGVRSDLMQVLAESYAARGRVQEAQAIMARARRSDPHCSRLPHVGRIVADHLAQAAIALTYKPAGRE